VDKLHPLERPQPERASGCGLFVVTLAGGILIVLAVRHNVGRASVELEVGAALMLFAILYYLQRVLIRRQTSELIRRIDANLEDLSPVPEHRQGALAVAFEWLEAMAAGDYMTGWRLSDDNWRLCRAQSWIWSNRLIISQDHSIDEVERALAQGDAKHPLWAAFVYTESEYFRDYYSGVDTTKIGVGSEHRPTGRDYDLLLFPPLDESGKGYFVLQPMVLNTRAQVLIRKGVGEHGWLVASHCSVAPPTPGRPPSWWVVGDLTFKETPDGLKVTDPAPDRSEDEDRPDV
jgi:hypothetical protein